ncbi:MAG: four-carbon acid sugar kinase family protein, partial [Rhodobiaceae bacterium]|nr:four-carbon acid sugar kinase family protein [Rhodobiaceae bacterium]
KPVCIAVGSTDPITLAQVAMLRRTRPETAFVAAPNGAVSAKPDATLRPVTLLQATPGPQAQPADVATRFAQGSADWLRRAATLVLTGGATAEAILDRLEIEVLTVQGEALPGMPYCRAGAQGIVTKSGGFGGPDAFVQLTE